MKKKYIYKTLNVNKFKTYFGELIKKRRFSEKPLYIMALYAFVHFLLKTKKSMKTMFYSYLPTQR